MRAARVTELADLPLEEASRLLRRGKISPIELTEAALERIALLEPEQHSFITILKDAARRQAREAAREIARGKWRGPLHGIPVSLKDNFETRGVRTTAGSKILAQSVPAKDSAVAAKLKQAGAILLGKTNLHEFAYGVTTENPFFGSTQNPWSRGRIAGGSSGGSAAAIASGMGFGSVGTDTGGSVRIPSALCGVVGLKPTFGLVSLEGCVPLAESLDHAGPMARDVSGACIMLEAIAGNYPQGARWPDYRRLRAWQPRRFRIGWPNEYFFERVDPEIVRAVETAGEALESLGGRSQKISLPHLNASTAPSTVIALAEAADYHKSQGWFPARAGEYSEDLKLRLQQGSELRAVDYLAACRQRTAVVRDFDAAFERVDILIAPTTPVAAPPFGTREVCISGQTEGVRAALLRLNRPANYTGHPAITLPCGFTREGLPIGLQLIGPRYAEVQLLAIAHAYEAATMWHARRPALTTR